MKKTYENSLDGFIENMKDVLAEAHKTCDWGFINTVTCALNFAQHFKESHNKPEVE